MAPARNGTLLRVIWSLARKVTEPRDVDDLRHRYFFKDEILPHTGVQLSLQVNVLFRISRGVCVADWDSSPTLTIARFGNICSHTFRHSLSSYCCTRLMNSVIRLFNEFLRSSANLNMLRESGILAVYLTTLLIFVIIASVDSARLCCGNGPFPLAFPPCSSQYLPCLEKKTTSDRSGFMQSDFQR